MKRHRFTLVLAGVAGVSSARADALYEAMNGDIEFNMRDGVAYVDVARRAQSLRDAILSAIRDLDSANTGARVVRVESEAANTVAKINADLLGTAGSQ